MVKKLVVKKLKSVAKDSQLSATIRDSAQQIWLAGLGATAGAGAGRSNRTGRTPDKARRPNCGRCRTRQKDQ